MKDTDVVIIGGGAAGLFCALTAAKRQRRVVVIEHANKVGKKILMSGGGRCNFTNLYTSADNYLSNNPHFCKSALSGYSPYDFLELVNQYEVPYHEKKLGQLFCDNSSKDIVAMLLAECDKYAVDILVSTSVESIERNQNFDIKTTQGHYQAESVIIATGGLSIPKMGATSFGYKIAEQFDLNVLPTRASLVPFVFTDHMKAFSSELSGVSVPVKVYNQHCEFKENILFTHRGLSGPASLQASNYWLPGEILNIDLLPDHDVYQSLLEAKKVSPNKKLKNVLNDHFPKNLIAELETLWGEALLDHPLQHSSVKDLEKVAKHLKEWQIKPGGTEGYRTAEVTIGGVDTNELSSKTMMSNKVDNLFFIGEVVDVTGHLGGFNFQWAWASAAACGQVC